VLNRPTQKQFSDGTPTASYYYDESTSAGLTLANTKGRLSHSSSAAGATATYFSYDPMGRVQDNWQCTDGFYKRECQENVFPRRRREGRFSSFSPFRQPGPRRALRGAAWRMIVRMCGCSAQPLVCSFFVDDALRRTASPSETPTSRICGRCANMVLSETSG
jgi:hypothetical protein